jgi:hypothetical protein
MYFRDTNALLADTRAHVFWVALEAASGIVSQHDYDPNSYCTHEFNGCGYYGKGAWWNVTADPFDDATQGTESPLWSFVKYRVLNRLALRTKLPVSTEDGRGSGGALVYLKHDSAGPSGDAAILIFNPGPAQNLTIDLSSLPRSLLGGNVVPYDLLTNESAVKPLAKSWTIGMKELEMRFMSGFGLGVYAPRKGKKDACKADDGYSKVAQSTTLQSCFLECANDDQCENVHVEFVNILWMETPPPLKCTLLGKVTNPSQSCQEGTGTLVTRMDHGRRCHAYKNVAESVRRVPGGGKVAVC